MNAKHTSITKGSEVWVVAPWDHKATVSVRRLSVQSMGKKQGTATVTENGKFIKCHILPQEIGKTVFNVVDISDVAEFAMQKAIEHKDRMVQHYRDRAHFYLDSASDAYHIGMKEDCEAVLAATPSVIYR